MEDKMVGDEVKSYTKLFLICLNVCLSAFYVGYSLVYVGMLKEDDFQKVIVNDYGFFLWDWTQQSYKSIVQGALPIGAIIGALLSSQVIKLFSRLKGFLITNIVLSISIILLILIKNQYIFLLMRIIQGICTGVFSAIVPLYINQTVTPSTSNLGSLNQIVLSFGQFFCCGLSEILDAVVVYDGTNGGLLSVKWGILAGFPLVTIIVQSFTFLFIFRFDTAKYLIKQDEIVDARYLVKQLYSGQYAEQILDDLEERNQPDIGNIPLINREGQMLDTSKVAIFFAIHIAILQQMSGVNAIAVYGKNTIQQALKGHDTIFMFSTLGLYALPFIASLVTAKVMKIYGRKYLIQIGTGICGICLAVVAIAFIFKGDKNQFIDSIPESILIIVGMCVFMFVFGLTLGPIVWLYIPEIVEDNVIPFSTMANLLGASLCIIVFPLIHHNVYIPFIFFFIWCLISLYINHRLMVQTRNKPRQEVFKQFYFKKII